jgi:hypothetical protein
MGMTDSTPRPKFNHGTSFRREALELYDGTKHLGRALPGSKRIALYEEHRARMSTLYRSKLIQFVKRELGWNSVEISWF